MQERDLHDPATEPSVAFRHMWTVFARGRIRSWVVEDGIAYVLSDGAVAAIRLHDGHTLWSQHGGKKFGEGWIVVEPDVVFVAYRRERWIDFEELFAAFDRKTGARRFKRKVASIKLRDVFDGVIYSVDRRGRASAVDFSTGKVRWKRFVLPYPSLNYPSLNANGDVLLVCLRYCPKFALDARTGQELWRTEEKGIGPYVFTAGLMVLLQGDEFVARNPRTREELWRCPSLERADSFVLGDLWILEDGHEVVAIELQSGKIAWRRWINSTEMSRENRLPSGRSARVGELVLIQKEGIHAIDQDGRLQWRSERLKGLAPMGDDGEVLAMADEDKIHGYVREAEDPVPTDRKACRHRIEEMVRRFEALDPWEREILDAMRPDSFDALLNGILERHRSDTGLEALAFRALTEDRLGTVVEAFLRDIEVWRIVEGEIPDLDFISKKHFLFAEWLAAPEFRDFAAPYLLKALKGLPPKDWGSESLAHPIVETLIEMGYEPAIEWLAKGMDDERVAETFRRHLFATLASMGPQAATVVADRARRQEIHREHWPDVSRPAETELERAVEAAFAASPLTSRSTLLDFPEGMPPFAMRGSRSICHTQYEPPEEHEYVSAKRRQAQIGISIIDADRLEEGGTVRIMVSAYWGPTSAVTWEVWVERFDDIWISKKIVVLCRS